MVRYAKYHPRVLWSRLKTRLPLLVWILAILAMIPLVALTSRGQVMSGMVERKVVPVGSTLSGTVYDVWVKPGDVVTNGQVMARLDPSEIDIQIGAALWQRERDLEAEERWRFEQEKWRHEQEQRLATQKAEMSQDAIVRQVTRQDRLDEQKQRYLEEKFNIERRIDKERADLATDERELRAIRDARVRLEAEQVRLMGLEDYTSDIAELKADEQTLQRQVATYPDLIRTLESQLRSLTPPPSTPSEMPAGTTPLALPQIPLTTPRSRLLDGDEQPIDEVDRLRWMRQQTVVYAPESGVVSEVLLVPGQHITAGVPVINITLTNNNTIIGFIPELAPELPEIGSRYRLERKVKNAATIPIEVTSVAPDIVSLPARPSLLAFNGPPRGRYIYFNVLEPTTLIPGEGVTIIARENWMSSAVRWVRDTFSPGEKKEETEAASTSASKSQRMASMLPQP